MKRIILSLVLCLSLLSLTVATVFAEEIPSNNENNENETCSWEKKINENLLEKMLSSSNGEEIPVWIWFSDIDMNRVAEEVEKKTGLTEDMISVIDSDSVPSELKGSLEDYSFDGSKSDDYMMSDDIKRYMESTKSQREEEQKLSYIYRNAKRKIACDMYIDNNDKIINKLGISEKNFIFKSVLSPSAIVLLSKEDILRVSKSDLVDEIYLYEEAECEEPDYSYTNQMKTMRWDTLTTNYELSGYGVNVLMIDHDFVRPNYYTGYSFSNQTYINNVYINTVYPATNTSSLPSACYSHGTLVASALQKFAPDATIYCVSKNTQYSYTDIEWAILNCDIDIINGSVNYGTPEDYLQLPQTRWFDGLVKKHNVALIASAGNDYGWSSTNWPNVISPACGYNSIAVGAYITNGNSELDYMHNYRYNPIIGNDLVCYKPDVVIASYSTSQAAPSLSGIVACLLEMRPSLKSEPEEIKAILMASCHRKVKPTSGDSQELMSTGLTPKQGAGAVDAYRAARIVMTDSFGYATISSDSVTISRDIKVKYFDNLNVSIAWNRQNVNLGNQPSNGVNLGTIQELNLDILNQSGLSVKESTVSNSGKQLAYLENASPNQIYRMKITKVTPNNTEQVKFGYAWSERGTKKLKTISMTGLKAQGQMLSISVTNSNGTIPTNQDVNYIWQRSSDGYTWQTISNATNNSYTLSNSDFMKYIRCKVSPTNSSLLATEELTSTTDTKIVIIGDVDLDESVSVCDVTLIQRYLVQLETFNEEQMIAADVDLDGDITIVDVNYIQRYLVGLEPQLPIQN